MNRESDFGTLIGTVRGIDFHEHSRFGDEWPLLARIGGKIKTSDFYELPDRDEVADWLEYIEAS